MLRSGRERAIGAFAVNGREGMRGGIGLMLAGILILTACGGGGGGGDSGAAGGGGSGGGGAGDTVAPSVPSGLVITPTSATSIGLAWQASADNIGVTGYRIYRDNAFLRMVASTASSDANLATGVSYCYEVSAMDAAGNESARSAIQCATPSNVWTSRLPGVDITVKAIIHDGQRYVAVGDPSSGNYVLTSTDGEDWTAHATSQTVLGLEDIVWTGTQYIATSDRGTFYTSPDAIGWTIRHLLTGLVDINALAWSGSRAVAVGEDGNILSTADGITWTEHAGITTEYLNDVEWLNGQFVAVGANGTVLFSPDGLNWSVESTGTADFLDAVAWSASAQTYLAVGLSSSFVSTDGITWAPVVLGGLFEDAIWADALDLFVAVDTNGRIVTSPDGMAWTERVDIDQFYSLDTIFADDTQLIAGGDIGEIVTSLDGITWVTRASAADFEQVRWDGAMLYAVGGPSKLATSPNGIDWSFHRTGYSGDYIHDIVNSGTRLLAAAQTYYMSTPMTLDSPWPVHDWIGATTHDFGVIWDGTQFVSVGSNGGMRVSADGISYTYIYSAVTGTTEPLRSIIYTGGQYVVVGNNGTILTAPDLGSWTSRTSGTTNHLYGVAHSGSRYVAAGSGGTILTSADAATWSPATSNTTQTLYSVIWAGDGFVTVGAGSTVLVSADGVDWTPLAQSLPASTYKGVAFTGTRLVVVGNNGAVVTIERP